MKGLQFAYFITNTITVYELMLVLHVIFAVPFCRKPYRYVLVGLGDLLLHIVLCGFPELAWWEMSCAEVAYGLLAVVFVAERKGRAFLFWLPSLNLYLQWSTVLSVVLSVLDDLFSLKKSEVEIGGKIITMGTLGWLTDVLLLLLLLLLASRTSWNPTASETVFMVAFGLFCPVLKTNLNNTVYSITWCMSVILLNAAVFYGIRHRKGERHYREVSQNQKLQFNEEYQYFKDYKQEQREMAGLRHDWNNHLLLLSSLFERGEYEKAKAYFLELSGRYQSGGKGILTGNELVDIILNAKAERLEQGGIAVSCSGGLEALGFMEPVDCCILFANLIDNAIEANEKCEEERYIRIALSENAGNIMLSIENQWNGDWKLADGKPISTKDNAETHGVGTRNAFAVVEKYHGTYRLLTRKEGFAVQMIFSSEK